MTFRPSSLCLLAAAFACGGEPPSITESPPDYASEYCEEVPVPSHQQENVGAIAGKAGVSGGSASYQIQITTAPGRRGLEPKVALSYSNRTGNGVAGVGWSLSGASRIHRCPQTIAQDGRVHGVDLSSSDRLCLDGNRLLVVEGSYGAAGSVYRTEQDGFERITQQGGDLASSNTWFQVEAKDGSISTYGAHHGDSAPVERYASAPAPSAWWIRRTSDRQKNAVFYAYDWSGGQHRLSRIDYTGYAGSTAAQDLHGDRWISFDYEPRLDPTISYEGGVAVKSVLILSAINSIHAGNIVRRYELLHEQSRATGRSLLSQVIECTSDPCRSDTQLPPTTFTYQDAVPSYRKVDLPGGQTDHWDHTLGSDFDGDGTRDYMLTETREPWGGGQILTNDICFTDGACVDVRNTPWGDGGFRRVQRGLGPWGNTDFNVDGLADLVGNDGGFIAFRDYLGQTTVSTLPTASEFYVNSADFNGDGRTDIVAFDANFNYQLHLQSPASTETQLMFLAPVSVPVLADHTLLNVSDFDGDGLPDMFFDWSANPTQTSPSQRNPPLEPRILFTRLTGNTVQFDVVKISDLGGPAGSFTEYGTRAFADINGDGLEDIYRLYVAPAAPRIWLNQGGIFLEYTVNGTANIHRKHLDDVMVFDQDGDGQAEILYPVLATPQPPEFIGFCYRAKNQAGEWIDYCSDSALSNRDIISSAYEHHDHSVYGWEAIDFEFDGGSALSATLRPTGLFAPKGRSRPMDYSGDGLIDVGYSLKQVYGARGEPLGTYPGGAGGNKVARYFGPAPDLMVAAINGLEVRSTWKYAPLSANVDNDCRSTAGLEFYVAERDEAWDGEHYLFTSSMQVVAKFEESNGAGGSNRRCYFYENAMANNRGRGVLGFRKITEEEHLRDGDDLRTVTRYHQRFPLVSSPAEVSIYLASDATTALPIKKTLHSWSSHCQNDGDASTPAQYCFNYIGHTVEETRDLPVARPLLGKKTIEYQYNPTDVLYGNLTTETRTTEDAYMKTVEVTGYRYDYTDANRWWINRQTEKAIATRPVEYFVAPLVTPAQYPENNSKSLVHVRDYYPDNHALWARLPKFQETQTVASNEYSRVDYDSYDSHGNLYTERVTAANVPASRTTSYEYSGDGYFLWKVTNPRGHVVETLVDAETGLPTNIIDANNQETVLNYDSFGRLLRTDKHPLPSTYRWMLSCGPDCPARGKYRVVTFRSGTPILTQYFDQLGRIIKTTETAFNPNQLITGVTEYDARGRVLRRSEPSFNASGDFFTRYEEHDPLGRPARKIVDKTQHVDFQNMPDETFVTEYFYEGLTTRIVLDGRLTAYRTHSVTDKLLQTIDTDMTQPTGGNTVRYRYDGAGNLILLVDPAGNEVRSTFGNIAQKLETTDPNRGKWRFEYNGLGKLIKQTDANMVVADLRYDALDRATERKINGVVESIWTFDFLGKGLPDHEIKYDTTTFAQEHKRSFIYDGFFRLQTTRNEFDSLIFDVEQTYDCHGLVGRIDYPNNVAVEFRYNPFGYLKEERDPLSPNAAHYYRLVTAMNPRKEVTAEQFANGLLGDYQYYDATGQVRSICVSTGAGCVNPVQSISYEYKDPYGNLTAQEKRLSAVASVREVFAYDTLQRLYSSTRTWTGVNRPVVQTNYRYDALGNITVKTDFSVNYQYGNSARNLGGNAGPNAVRAIARNAMLIQDFLYDNNGNMIAGNGRVLQYDPHNKPKRIVEGVAATTFKYDASGRRYKQEAPGKTTRYVEGIYEEILTGPAIEQRASLGTSVVVSKIGTTTRVFYLHKDRLGSNDAISDALAGVERHGFDPFGLPRGAEWHDNGGDLASPVTTYGFTGHEHLDLYNLIHMNGRAYDPALGRFLSVDPVIQGIANSQAINPYSYIINNPLSGVDPSGYTRCDSGMKNVSCNYSQTMESVTGSNIKREKTTVTLTNMQTGARVTLTAFNGNISINKSFVNQRFCGEPSDQAVKPMTNSAKEIAKSPGSYEDGSVEPSAVQADDLIPGASAGKIIGGNLLESLLKRMVISHGDELGERAVKELGEEVGERVTKEGGEQAVGRGAKEGAETVTSKEGSTFGRRSVGAGEAGTPRVLQTGGNTVSKKTAQDLNGAFGENLHPREWGRALEALKKDLHLRGDHHGRIMSNGDYTDAGGDVLGNIGDYIP